MNKRTRSRWAILIGVALFLLTQASFNLAVRERWLPLLDPVYLEKYERLEVLPEFFAQSSAKKRILILGSSRSEMGFDARRFSEQFDEPTLAFNFATPGGGPITNSLYLRRLLRDGVKPDAVLLEIHPCLLCGDLEKNWLIGYRLRPGERDYLNSIGISPHGATHLGLRGWFTAVHAYRYPVLNKYAERWLPCPFGFTLGLRQDAFGYVRGLDLPAHERPSALQKAIQQYRPVLTKFRPEGAAITALQDLVSTCKTQRIPLMAYLSPEATSFQEAYEVGATERLRNVLSTLGVTVIETRECVPDDLFADGHHLMPEGANVFTDALVKECKKLPK